MNGTTQTITRKAATNASRLHLADGGLFGERLILSYPGGCRRRALQGAIMMQCAVVGQGRSSLFGTPSGDTSALTNSSR